MEKITAFRCEYCDSIFLTATRHRCKYDPKFKNCYSCKHNMRFYEDSETVYGYDGREIDKPMVSVDCDKGWRLSAWDIEQKDKNLGCEDHEYCGGKWYENKHAKYRESQFLKGLDGADEWE